MFAVYTNIWSDPGNDHETSSKAVAHGTIAPLRQTNDYLLYKNECLLICPTRTRN